MCLLGFVFCAFVVCHCEKLGSLWQSLLASSPSAVNSNFTKHEAFAYVHCNWLHSTKVPFAEKQTTKQHKNVAQPVRNA